jgi:hypothetical protein
VNARGRLAVVLGVASACVPRTAAVAPRGAIAIATVPSPGSRGEPFVTTDGWTVRVEQLVLLARFSATSGHGTGDPRELKPRTGEARAWLFRASDPVEPIVRAIDEGPARALIEFEVGFAIFGGGLHVNEEPRRIVRAVDGALEQRFREAADNEGERCVRGDAECFEFGPSFHLVATAERGTRTERVDLAPLYGGIGRISISEEREVPTVVVANELTRVELPVRAEALFTDEEGTLLFDDIAGADTNGDGIVSTAELETADSKVTRNTPGFDPGYPPPPEPDAGADGGPDGGASRRRYVLSLFDALTARARYVFAPAAR